MLSSVNTAVSAFSATYGPTLLSQKIIVGLNLLGYGITLAAPQFHYHVDLLGTGAFAVSTIPTLLQASKLPARLTLTSAAVAVWSTKLAGYLFYRVLQRGSDTRMDDVLSSPYYAAGFWIYSAAWGVVCSLPYSIGLSSTVAGSPLLVSAGLGIFGVGWAVETMADIQKYQFKQEQKQQKSSTPAFCDKGLWAITQHPNYFGNFVLWLGILVANANALYIPPPAATASIWQKLWGARRLSVALIGPMFMWNLFMSQANGTLLGDSFQAQREKLGYGTNPEYTRYIDGTSGLQASHSFESSSFVFPISFQYTTVFLCYFTSEHRNSIDHPKSNAVVSKKE